MKSGGAIEAYQLSFFIYKISLVMGFSKYCDKKKEAKTLSSKDHKNSFNNDF